MVESSSSETHIGEKPVKWCPVCGTSLTEKSLDTEVNVCPSCGFDLSLVKSQKTLFSPETIPAYVPKFAYFMLAFQVVGSLLLFFLFYFLSSSLYIGMPQLIAYTFLFSIIICGVFFVLLRLGRGVSSVRIALLIFGLFTIPLGGCAIAAGLSISTVGRFCMICGKRIAWSASYFECPHCHSVWHKWGRCRLTRTELIAKAWGREPTRYEVDNTCPKCFENIMVVPTGGEKA
ncbi:MAG: hypothetical protein ACFFDP_04095 [Promethearchaeota archaeon]